jgi:hypothetical protein
MFSRLLIIVALICCGFVFGSFGQTSTSLADFTSNLADRPIERTRYRFPNATEFLKDVALDDDVPIILEVPTVDDFRPVSINFKGGSLSDLLDQFTDVNPAYRWEIVNGLVHVYPTVPSWHTFTSELLTRKAARILVQPNTDTSNFLGELLKSQDVKDLEESTGMKHQGFTIGGFSFPRLGKHYSKEIMQGTVMDALGEVIKGSPTTRIWIIGTVESDHKYYISFEYRYETDDKQK